MTLKHLAEGLMQATGAHSQSECEQMLGLPQALICRLQKGTCTTLWLATFLNIADRSGLPVDLLASWCRLPDDAVLGRVQLPPTVQRLPGRVTTEFRRAA